MKANVLPELEPLLRPIGELKFLEGNPRKGDVRAIAASYEEFGQVRPIVGIETDDGITIIAGNHQLKAATSLGWTHIAVSVAPFGDKKAIAFALADNRVSELGTTDSDLVYEMLDTVITDMPEFFETLGWDDFEMALLEPTIIDSKDGLPPSEGWQPPELIDRDSDNEMHWAGDKDKEKDLITQGATSGGVSGSSAAVVQYTLVFDSPEQQAHWYKFLRWVKANDSLYPGKTTAARLNSFLDIHMREVDEREKF